MLSWIKELLFFPDLFFLHRDREKADLVRPAIIVGLSGLTSAAFLVGSTRLLDPFLLLMISYSLLWMTVMPFIGWGLYTILFYYLGRSVSGSGTIERIAQNTGYGMLPGTLLGFVSLGGFSVVMNSPGLVSGLVGSDPLEIQWLIAVSGVILSFISLFWSGYIWTYGLSHAHTLPLRKAVLVVAIVVILSALMIVWPLILNEMMMRMYSVR